jgi:hypothetical protein
MAFKTSELKNLNNIEIVSSVDPALDVEKEVWLEYAKNPTQNVNLLKLKEKQEPTRFLCNFEFSGDEAAEIKDAMIKRTARRSKEVNVSYGSWQHTVTRLALKDIKDPSDHKDGIKFKKDSLGYVSDFTMSQLTRFGIIPDIFEVYVNLTQTSENQEIKN